MQCNMQIMFFKRNHLAEHIYTTCRIPYSVFQVIPFLCVLLNGRATYLLNRNVISFETNLTTNICHTVLSK